MASESFSLSWDDFSKNLCSNLFSFYENEDMVDVTLAAEGKQLKAHKMVLSLNSPYFHELFQSNPCQHPIVFLKDVSYTALKDLIKFMYSGEVQVAQEDLNTFIKTAEALQIKGLIDDNTDDNSSEFKRVDKAKPVSETIKRTHETVTPKVPSVNRVRNSAGPASKRPKQSATQSKPADATPVRNETSVASATLAALDTVSLFSNGNETPNEATGVVGVEPKLGVASKELSESQGYYKFLTNEAGRQDLIYHQQIYKFDKLTNGKKLWKCASDDNCPAICLTSPGTVLQKTGIHPHLPPMLKDKQEQIIYKKLD